MTKGSESVEAAITRLLSLPSTSTHRLRAFADYLKLLIERRGLPGVRGGTGGELAVPGLARTKDWDVAYEFAGKFRLLVSLKSMLQNVSGSVPNRLDDLQGELASVQQLRPEIVIGYVILFDVAMDKKRKDNQYWSEFLEGALKRIAIRRAPLWNQGLLEGVWFIRFDSRKPAGKRLVNPRRVVHEREAFITALLCELHHREPAVQFTKTLPCQ